MKENVVIQNSCDHLIASLSIKPKMIQKNFNSFLPQLAIYSEF